MNTTLNILHKLDQELIFKGLPAVAIKYLRRNGLWMPVTKEILDVPASLNDTCQLYINSPGHDDYLTFVIEHGEFLTGAIYSHVDNNIKSVDGFLHQYSMEEGGLTFEVVQAIHNDILFLALTNDTGDILIEWEEAAIEKILKL